MESLSMGMHEVADKGTAYKGDAIARENLGMELTDMGKVQ